MWEAKGDWDDRMHLPQEQQVTLHLGLAAAEGCAKVAAQGYESSDGGAVGEEVQRLQTHAHLGVHPRIAAGALGPGVKVQDPRAILFGRRSLSSLPTCSSSSKFSTSSRLQDLRFFKPKCISETTSARPLQS